MSTIVLAHGVLGFGDLLPGILASLPSVHYSVAPSTRYARSGFRVKAPVQLALRSRPQCRSKCNEALSRDLWPLDPFESAPMRATSSVISNSIPCAIWDLLKLKDLAELLAGKAGRNSLPLKKLLGGIFC
jgi:hypothetical protein